MSATGDSDTRNYYDMISSRQEIDLRPQLDRLDRLILRSAGVDPAALTFEFRPLWQLDAAEKATVALSKAQATQLYAGLNLWPAAVTARLIQAQLVEDGTYPNAETIFAEVAGVSAPGAALGNGAVEGARGEPASAVADFDPDQPRDPDGRWSDGEGSGLSGTPVAAVPVARSAAPSTMPATNSGASQGIEGIAPDGTAVEPAAFKKGGKGPARAIAALLGYAAKLLQRWRPQEPDDPEPTPPPHTGIDPNSPAVEPPSPADSDENGRLEPSPPGIVITIKGKTTTELGDSYSTQVRDFYGGIEPRRSKELGSTVPDGLFLVESDNGPAAMEAKYIRDWSASEYNPDSVRPYEKTAVNEVVQQAIKYARAYPLGVRWVTNSSEFAQSYTPRFVKAGVKNFSFVIIPAVKEGFDAPNP